MNMRDMRRLRQAARTHPRGIVVLLALAHGVMRGCLARVLELLRLLLDTFLICDTLIVRVIPLQRVPPSDAGKRACDQEVERRVGAGLICRLGCVRGVCRVWWCDIRPRTLHDTTSVSLLGATSRRGRRTTSTANGAATGGARVALARVRRACERSMAR